MATEKNGSEDDRHPTGPTPNREGRREPTVIDATAEEVASEASSNNRPSEDETVGEESTEAPEPRPSRARPPRAPPAALSLYRVLPWVAVLLAGFAVLLAGGVGAHLFVTTDGAIVDLRKATATLQTHDAEFEKRLAATAKSAAGLARLERRVASLESAMQSATARLAALRSETKKAISLAQARPPAAAPAPQVDLAPLKRRIAAIAAQIQPLAAAIAASKANVSANAANVRKAVAASNAAALVVVSQSLIDAIDRGAPFASEVAAAQALGADPDQIAALRPVAPTGASTAAALAESFAPLAAPILTGAKSKQPRGLLERLERDASSLVRVRPVGAPRGDNPTALIAQIEDALGHGDVAAALSAWNQLPATAKKVTGDWASAARARLKADTAAHALLADAIQRLGRSKS